MSARNWELGVGRGEGAGGRCSGRARPGSGVGAGERQRRPSSQYSSELPGFMSTNTRQNLLLPRTWESERRARSRQTNAADTISNGTTTATSFFRPGDMAMVYPRRSTRAGRLEHPVHRVCCRGTHSVGTDLGRRCGSLVVDQEEPCAARSCCAIPVPRARGVPAHPPCCPGAGGGAAADYGLRVTLPVGGARQARTSRRFGDARKRRRRRRGPVAWMEAGPVKSRAGDAVRSTGVRGCGAGWTGVLARRVRLTPRLAVPRALSMAGQPVVDPGFLRIRCRLGSRSGTATGGARIPTRSTRRRRAAAIPGCVSADGTEWLRVDPTCDQLPPGRKSDGCPSRRVPFVHRVELAGSRPRSGGCEDAAVRRVDLRAGRPGLVGP